MKNKKRIILIILIVLLIVGIGVGSYAAYLVNATDVSYTRNGSTVTVEAALNDLYSKVKVKKWSAGDLVTYRGEQFYVLNDVYEGQTTCEIFAKTNLNQEATDQANAAYGTTACAFSSTNYWSSSWVSGKGVNLNNYPGFTATDVMGKVDQYVRTKAACGGRLLTYDEAEQMIDSGNTKITDMLWGRGNSQGYARGWLESAYGRSVNDGVWIVDGENSDLYSAVNNGDACGVRPVLTVFVSQLS